MSNISTVIKSIQDVMRQDSGVDGDAQRISQLTWLLFLKVFDAQEEELELTRDGYKSPIPEHLRWRNWATDAEGITGDGLLDFRSSKRCRVTPSATRAASWCAACLKTPTTT
jgi:type I restriction enzyme M protein